MSCACAVYNVCNYHSTAMPGDVIRHWRYCAGLVHVVSQRQHPDRRCGMSASDASAVLCAVHKDTNKHYTPLESTFIVDAVVYLFRI